MPSERKAANRMKLTLTSLLDASEFCGLAAAGSFPQGLKTRGELRSTTLAGLKPRPDALIDSANF